MEQNNIAADGIDLLAEKAVISGLFNHGYNAWVDISDIINNDCFISEVNSITYHCINYIFKEKGNVNLDWPTLISSSRTLGFGDYLEQSDEKDYLIEAKKEHVELSSVKSFAQKLRKLEITRGIRSKIQQADKELAKVTGEESISKILNLAEQPVFELHQVLKGFDKFGPKLILNEITDYLDKLEGNPVKQIGIATGWPTFDKLNGGGLIAGSVNMIAARFKQGKSSIADNIALHVTKLGVPCLMLDTEMLVNQHYNRLLANLSGISINDIKTGQYSLKSTSRDKVRKAAEFLKILPYDYLNISGQEFEETISEMRRWIMTKVGLDNQGKANPCVIILDYLKIMNESTIKNITEWQKLGFMATAFTNFCIKYNVPALCFVQLNRENDVAASDRLAWYFSVISYWSKQEKAEIDRQREIGVAKPYNMKLYVANCRDGEGHDIGDYLNMNFKRDICKIEEGPNQLELEETYKNTSGDGEIIGDDDKEVDF